MRNQIVTVAIAVLLCGNCVAESDVPLGDVARAKTSTSKAKRVLTDEDMPSPAAIAEPNASKSASKVDDLSGVSEMNENETPLTPEQKLTAMQRQLEQLRAYEASLTKHLKEVTAKLDNEPREFRRNMYSEALQRQAGTLEMFKKQRAELEAAIAKEKTVQSPETSSEAPEN